MNKSNLLYTIGIVILGILGFLIYKSPVLAPNMPGDGVACTKEAKLCPDGSSVGRTGPRCEFAICPAPKPTGGCFVGGCSGQVCSEEEGVITTCEYREEYACYKNAKCERQTDGKCGWTETPALSVCINGALNSSTNSK